MRLRASEAAASMDGRLAGADRMLSGCVMDSRRVSPGDLFFAIRGGRRDGHAFIGDAVARGAGAVVVASDSGAPAPGDDADFGQIRVGDTTRALGALARAERLASGARVVAITGSLGKTTAKEAAAAAISTTHSVFRSPGNWNNHWGLPLSLLARKDEEVGVLELGMSAAGEIGALADIAVPDVGVVTTVAEAHLEFFDSLEAIADAKGELYEALPASATAVANADDPLAAKQVARHDGARVFYGFADSADVRGAGYRRVESGLRFTVRAFDGPEAPVACGLSGRHNASNVLAGLAAAAVLDVPIEAAARGVRGLRALPGRGRRRRLAGGAWAVDETYNSSPRALLAAAAEFAERPEGRDGRRILVVGDMLELGDRAVGLHRDCGWRVGALALDLVVGVGRLGGVFAAAAKEAGARCAFAESPEGAAALLRDELRSGDVALFKASRGVALDGALDALGAEAEAEAD